MLDRFHQHRLFRSKRSTQIVSLARLIQLCGVAPMSSVYNCELTYKARGVSRRLGAMVGAILALCVVCVNIGCQSVPASGPMFTSYPVGAVNTVPTVQVNPGQPTSMTATGSPTAANGIPPATPGVIQTAPSSTSTNRSFSSTGPSGYPRYPQPVSGGVYQPSSQSPQMNVTRYQSPGGPIGTGALPPGGVVVPDATNGQLILPNQTRADLNLPQNFADIEAFVQEDQTGRLMIGAGFNSDAGVTGQLIIDERNFDITNVPTSWRQFVDGTAFRGGGQGFRFEAIPGAELQRYLVSFSEPYLAGTNVSMNISGYYYDRDFFDWQEQRIGGRVAFGYRLTPDLSVSAGTRIEQVQISRPRVGTSPELNAVLGDNDLYIGQVTLTHDTRDNAFSATEGHYIELSFQQAFGSADYPRADIDYRRYFLVRERPDGSGRHTISVSTRVGFSGAQTPLFENYFAGGFSTLRGFDFRGASPLSGGVRVGGQFRWVNSVEYLFPLTADDMIKGIVFCDFGTVEQDITLNGNNFRVAPGFGLRINIPALGNGAPLAFDFAFPIAHSDSDDLRNFSFFLGLLR